MLILSRKVHEKIVISNEIVISIVEVHNDVVKLGITAPPSVKVYRQEIFDAIQEENRKAALSLLPPGLDLPKGEKGS